MTYLRPSNPNLSIIGLGKLGSSMAAAFASRGFKVFGVDVNPDFVKLVNEGKPPVFEPKLKEYLAENKERISAAQDLKSAVLNSDITFIIVPTPSREGGEFSTEYVQRAAKEIGEALKEKKSFHLVVLTSTVSPGSSESDILPVLEECSGKKAGKGFGFCYNPEFIALGNVIFGLLAPDFVLIGESDKKSGEILESFYNDFCENSPPVKRMSIINAEIAKISLNAFITNKMSFANMLAELCEKIPGGDVDAVTGALGCDARIGRKYFKGALGYGGPCFPRDGRAIIATAKKFGVSLPLVEATDKVNLRQIPRLVGKILNYLPAGGRAAVLGLAYKPDTPVIEESQGLAAAEILCQKNISLAVFDSLAAENAKKVLKSASFPGSLKEAVRGADVIAITIPCPEFKNIKPEWLKQGSVIIDCWRLLDKEKYKEKVKYIGLGTNQNLC